MCNSANTMWLNLLIPVTQLYNYIMNGIELPVWNLSCAAVSKTVTNYSKKNVVLILTTLINPKSPRFLLYIIFLLIFYV